MTNSIETTDEILCVYARGDCDDLTKITCVVTTRKVHAKYANKLRAEFPNLATVLLSSSHEEPNNLANNVYSNNVGIICSREIGLKYGLKCLKELD